MFAGNNDMSIPAAIIIIGMPIGAGMTAIFIGGHRHADDHLNRQDHHGQLDRTDHVGTEHVLLLLLLLLPLPLIAGKTS
jgi:hypothetical protein